jgi:hypothetical protein
VDFPIVDWLLRNSDWLGFPAMALIGGAVGHIESIRPGLRTGRCLWGLALSEVKAVFIAALFFQLARAWGGNLALWFFATGLCSVFSSDSIRTLYVIVRTRIKRVGNGP